MKINFFFDNVLRSNKGGDNVNDNDIEAECVCNATVCMCVFMIQSQLQHTDIKDNDTLGKFKKVLYS